MQSAFSKSSLLQADLGQRAVLSTEAVRLDQLNEALSGVSPFGHRHSVDEIDGLDGFKFFADQSDTIFWSYLAPVLTANVRVKANAGLQVLSGVGMALDFGSGPTQAAPGDHTHAKLHDAITLVSGVTIGWSLSGQILGAEVRYGPNTGLKSDAQGLALDFGPAAGQVAAGNHGHAQLHDPLTVLNSATVNLTLAGQQLQADLLLAPGGALVSGVSGVGVDVGTGAGQVSAGNHSHADGTASSPGFLSVADKQKLDLYASLLNADECVPFYRQDECPAGEYVGGRRRWGQAMQVVEMHLTANPPVGRSCLLGLEVDGAVVETINIPAGTPPSEVNNQKTLTNIYVAASKYVRLVMVSGVGTIESEAGRIDCALTVKPAIASLSAVKVNAGGGAVSPFIADAFYGSGGTTQSDASTINLSAVTSPAPQGVYQSARIKYNDPNPFSYLFTGLARGISYTVRLHFAELFWTGIGKQKINLAVIGKTTSTLNNYDTLNETSGVRYKAVIKEFTVEPDSNGQMEVRLTPVVSVDNAFNLSVNGIELVPVG